MKRERLDWTSREPRRAAQLSAVGFWLDGTSAMVLVSNLSYEGCEMQSNHAFRQGETIGLALPGRGKIPAQVRWVKDFRAGARFITGNSTQDVRRARIGV